MATQIFYNGVDITNNVTITACNISDGNGGKQDYCKITFANGDKLWQEWKPQYNDVVRVKRGNCDSGKMFINGIESNERNYTLILLSTPTTAKKKNNKVWRDIKLSEVINDVSQSLGFEVQFYGFQDYFYKTLTQTQKTDIEFMCELCYREGFNVKIYDEKIIIFNEKTLYSADASGTIIPNECNYYEFYDNNTPLSSVTIKYYDILKRELISHTATAKDVSGKEETFIIKVDNQAQAERYAENILQHNNNFIQCGMLKLKDADKYSSGSVINLSEFKGYNGKWYIYESLFDTKNNNCIFYINKIRG